LLAKDQPILIDIHAEGTVSELIPARTLDVMLTGYETAGTRYLQDATYLGDAKAEGSFKMDAHCYYGDGSQLYHITEVEAVIAFNQLSYVTFAHMLATGRILQLGVIPPDKFLKLQAEGTWVRKSEFTYSKPIALAATNGHFKGTVAIEEMSYLERETNKSVKMIMRLNLETGATIGLRDARAIFPK